MAGLEDLFKRHPRLRAFARRDPHLRRLLARIEEGRKLLGRASTGAAGEFPATSDSQTTKELLNAASLLCDQLRRADTHVSQRFPPSAVSIARAAAATTLAQLHDVELLRSFKSPNQRVLAHRLCLQAWGNACERAAAAVDSEPDEAVVKGLEFAGAVTARLGVLAAQRVIEESKGPKPLLVTPINDQRLLALVRKFLGGGKSIAPLLVDREFDTELDTEA